MVVKLEHLYGAETLIINRKLTLTANENTEKAKNYFKYSNLLLFMKTILFNKRISK